MNKSIFRFIFLIIVLFIGTITFTDILQKPINKTFNYIKLQYENSITFIDDTISQHFNQVETITNLKKELLACKKQNLENIAIKNQLEELYKLNHSDFNLSNEVELVRTISYEKFGNINRVWIDFDDFNSSKIYGLVYKNYAAGIVISKDDIPLALLNKDPKSSYAVSIGSVKAPGIAHGNNSENIIVTYIPSWYVIKPGDEVITSGLDNIFFKGIKVGKVLSITKSQGYKKAIVKPYFNLDELGYFYIIKEVR